MAAANLAGMVLGVVGSLVQARFISPDELGFVRKFSVVSGYAAFLSLGLFTILQRDYPLLIGRGEHARARRVAAVVQSWCLLVSAVVCAALLVVVLFELCGGRYREAAAWFIQVVMVWATVYVVALTTMYRSGQEFESLARGQLLASAAGAAVIPLFWFWPFPAMVVRSITNPIVSAVYLHRFRPVRVGWCLPWREFLDLVKRGLRLYVSDYLRYMFWPTVEIWLMLWFAGDLGVGLLAFSRAVIEATSQLATAINQVYLPRIAQKFGQTGSVRQSLALAAKPALLNLVVSLGFTAAIWFLLPPVIMWAFPKYAAAVPLLNVLAIALIVTPSTVIYMLTVLDSYVTQLVAVLLGLAVFVGTSLLLHSLGCRAMAMVWGTLAGRLVFTLACLGWLLVKARAERAAGNTPEPVRIHSSLSRS